MALLKSMYGIFACGLIRNEDRSSKAGVEAEVSVGLPHKAVDVASDILRTM